MASKKPVGWRGEPRRHSDAAVLGWRRRVGLPGMPLGYKENEDFQRKLKQPGFMNQATVEIEREIWLRPFTKYIVEHLQRGDHITLKELERLLKEEGMWKSGPFKHDLTMAGKSPFDVHKYIRAMPGIKYDSPVYEETESGMDIGHGEPYLIYVASNQPKTKLPFMTR